VNMKIIEGKFNKAKIFTEVLEETAMGQIKTLCDQEYVKDSKIRIMPDVMRVPAALSELR